MALARGLSHPVDGAAFEVTLATPTPRVNYADSSLPFAVVRRPGFWKLLQLLRNADAVHIAAPALIPMLLASLLGKRWIVEHHGFQVICPNGQLVQEPEQTPCPGYFMAGKHRECIRCNAGNGWLSSLRLWLLTFVRRSLAKKARVNVVPTEWLGTQLKLPRTHTIPHGLPAGPEPATHAASEPSTFFFLGRLVPTKGVDVLIAAAARMRKQKIPFQIRIAGDGPERAALSSKAQAADLSACTDFIGKMSTAEASQEFDRATATVMPSIGGEVFGLVALESMLRGCPVVASDIGALSEVTGDTGLTFPIGDAAALAERLERLMREPAFADDLRHKARQRAVDAFGEEQMFAEHRRVLQDLVGGISKRS